MRGTKREAERYWVRRQAEIDEQGAMFVRPVKDSVADYLNRWLTSKASDLRPSTAESYERMIRCHIVPAIGAVPLAELPPAVIQSMVDAMRAGTGPEGRVESPRTCSYVRTVLRIALQDAVRLGELPLNPVDRTRAPKQSPRQVQAFTVEEGETLFARAQSTRLGPLLRFTFFSGLRRGEVLGLKWSDVDMVAGTVAVRRSRVAVAGKGLVQDPKTVAGIRVIVIPGPALEALRAQESQQTEDREAAGDLWRDEGWVFATAEGRALSPTNVSRDFRRLRDSAPCPGCQRPTSPMETGGTEYHCRYCGREWQGGTVLPRLPFHALRHSAVSVQLAAGVPLEIVSKRIGHKRLGLTADTYGHLMPEANQAAADAVDAFLAKRAAAAGVSEAEHQKDTKAPHPGKGRSPKAV